jgi:hypothetical protein
MLGREAIVSIDVAERLEVDAKGSLEVGWPHWRCSGYPRGIQLDDRMDAAMSLSLWPASVAVPRVDAPGGRPGRQIWLEV